MPFNVEVTRVKTREHRKACVARAGAARPRVRQSGRADDRRAVLSRPAPRAHHRTRRDPPAPRSNFDVNGIGVYNGHKRHRCVWWRSIENVKWSDCGSVPCSLNTILLFFFFKCFFLSWRFPDLFLALMVWVCFCLIFVLLFNRWKAEWNKQHNY